MFSFAGVGRHTKTYGQHTAGNAEILHGSSQRKGMGWDDAGISFKVHHGFRIEVFGVHGCAEEVGEYLKLGGNAKVVSIR